LNVLVFPATASATEVTREAVRVLRRVAGKFTARAALSEGLLGGIAIHKTGRRCRTRRALAARPTPR
jgi:3-isopropylmalate dehydrogenase